MELSNEKLTEMVAYEAFLRRAAALDFPFMLKGSYITRQYFADPDNRIPNDLDWLYLHPLEDPVDAQNKFNEWLIQLTEMDMNDGVRFRSFRENAFWRMMDYAMADDFPTVNTDIKCWVHGEELELPLDVSFNLDVALEPVPLVYAPLLGAPFTLPRTTPLPLQISWKLHQSLVRLRFKDIFDLIHLVRHPGFTTETLQPAFDALLKECSADNMDPSSLHYLLSGNLDTLFPYDHLQEEWVNWRHVKFHYEKALSLTDPDKLPPDLQRFMELFSEAMETAGVKRYAEEHLPKPQEHLPQPVAPTSEMPALTETAAAPKQRKNFLDILRQLFK